MAGGHMTGLAWAGISDAWEENQAQSNLSDTFEDAAYEKERRQRMLERIRAEEGAEGRRLSSQQENKYDRWALDNDF